MDDQNATVEVEGPMGFRARVRNVRAQDVLLLILLLSCTFFLWYSENANRAFYLEQHQITQTLLKTVIAKQAVLLSSVKESTVKADESSQTLTYVLTLTQEQRERLKLNMPPGLRKQINNGTQ
jgi:hypothetical protein